MTLVSEMFRKAEEEAEAVVDKALDGKKYYEVTDVPTGRNFSRRLDGKPMTDLGADMAWQEKRVFIMEAERQGADIHAGEHI